MALLLYGSSPYKMIQHLPKEVVEKIAAGEVVTSVTSIVKELVENSIDAGSSEIEVRISSDCLALEVADNGSGIEEGDFPLLCERYCTSKLRSLGDLEFISMYGFRGEALASISLCSKVTVRSNHSQGFEGRYTEGKLVSLKKVGVRKGTHFIISDLFYNNRTRRTYFLQNRDEIRNVLNLISVYSIFNYKIRFSVYIDDNSQEKFRYKSSGIHSYDDDKEILEVKKDALKYLYNIKHELICSWTRKIKVIFSQLTLHLKKAVFILFVNKRLVESKTVKSEVLKVYSNIIPKQKFPLIYIELELDPREVDVNIHPSKKEVLFSETAIVSEIKKIITSALETQETLVVPCSPNVTRHTRVLENTHDAILSAGSSTPSALKIYSCPLNTSLDSLKEYRKFKIYKLLSIQKLAEEIKEEDPDFFKSLTYVGHARDKMFVQHGMHLLLCDFKELRNVFFYQNFVMEFGNFERKFVDTSVIVEKAGCMDQLSAVTSKLTTSARSFLDDYFCIRVSENRVESLPVKFGIEPGIEAWMEFIAFVSEQPLDNEIRVFRTVLTRLAAIFSQTSCDEEKIFHIMKKKMVGTREAFANFSVLTTLKELYKQFERC